MENLIDDYLSRLELIEKSDKGEIPKYFPDEKVFRVVSTSREPWYADIVNFHVDNITNLVFRET